MSVKTLTAVVIKHEITLTHGEALKLAGEILDIFTSTDCPTTDAFKPALASFRNSLLEGLESSQSILDHVAAIPNLTALPPQE
jgi:hypothetical protein